MPRIQTYYLKGEKRPKTPQPAPTLMVGRAQQPLSHLRARPTHSHTPHGLQIQRTATNRKDVEFHRSYNLPDRNAAQKRPLYHNIPTRPVQQPQHRDRHPTANTAVTVQELQDRRNPPVPLTADALRKHHQFTSKHHTPNKQPHTLSTTVHHNGETPCHAVQPITPEIHPHHSTQQVDDHICDLRFSCSLQ